MYTPIHLHTHLIQVNVRGELIMNSCVLADNSATGERSGGALQIAKDGDDVGIATVTGCRFAGNKAAAYGGGAIYNTGRVSILSSVFQGNNAGAYGIEYGPCNMHAHVRPRAPTRPRAHASTRPRAYVCAKGVCRLGAGRLL
jgi:predicted outer membrane repeat protein